MHTIMLMTQRTVTPSRASTPPTQRARRLVLLAALVLGVLATLLATRPAAASDPSGWGCYETMPCIRVLQAGGGKLVVEFYGFSGQRWDEYHVRWSRPGITERAQNIGGSTRFTINKAHSGVTYTIKVQGCEQYLIGADDCTGWQVRQIRVR